eukprot:TRINITY_DN22457_c0_g1_i1.p1 TRINITY_DN22457_c0_g1~~TRINITY_DN22457_c0_g1_i1.p1  ORF type:complete len:246 (-),score=52.88 TRINITY_DN22457_c0_g1_i1:108-845(-)
MEICYQCGGVCDDDVTYCQPCYNQRSENDLRNEQLLQESEYNVRLLEGQLARERETTQRLEALTRSLREMLEAGRHADITFHVGGEVVRAHRAILASRSEAFKAMLESDSAEVGVIRLNDISAPALRAVLQHLYTGDFDGKSSQEHSLDILGAAHKYGMLDLKRMCEIAVGDSVTAATAVETLKQADLYQAEWVKRACLECIKSHYEEIVESAELRALVFEGRHPHLVMDILKIAASWSREGSDV